MQNYQEKATQTDVQEIMTAEQGTQTCEGSSPPKSEGDSSTTEDVANSDESSEGEWYYDYEGDPNYTGEPYHSQPMHCLRGNSYTTPGWMRVSESR